ncbi:MAG: Arm DNA-binding domain-containing protein [Steroidobacterales bacterium]
MAPGAVRHQRLNADQGTVRFGHLRVEAHGHLDGCVLTVEPADAIELPPSSGRLWRLRYRMGTVEKLLALGVYPDVPLKRAREKRDEARRRISRRDRSERHAQGGAGLAGRHLRGGCCRMARAAIEIARTDGISRRSAPLHSDRFAAYGAQCFHSGHCRTDDGCACRLYKQPRHICHGTNAEVMAHPLGTLIHPSGTLLPAAPHKNYIL